jgi:ATP/maltotriose-dependent transcriptional regulator MalT
MGGVTEPVVRARAAYRRRSWAEARAAFREALARGSLDADDLSALANCAWWLGDLDEALPALQGVYRAYLDAGEPGQAALAAMDIAYTLALRGEEAQATGWLGRAARLLEDRPDSLERGYLDYITGFEATFDAGDLDGALAAARQVQDVGERFGDETLIAAGVMGRGRVLLKQGQVGAGMALLDEAMVAAVSDELDPGWSGNIYCHLMRACEELADLRRAGEWTEVTMRWCERMPGAGPFLGICRVHRAQVLRVRGAWQEAEREVVRVCETVPHFDVGIVGEAHYQLGDLRRQRGDLAGAEAAFAAARRLGRDPQPGMALVHLARGQTATAATSIAVALATVAGDPLARARLLPAAVEITVAAGDLGRARAASDELQDLAATYATTGFAAQAAYARGLLLLAGGDAEAALARLRQAQRAWQDLGAPYETARTRVLLASAYGLLRDREAARIEHAAARDELARLGAAWPAVSPLPAQAGAAGLTPREAEVLGLVAAGRTNQQIAAELVLSIRTVERHLSTVYDKLGVNGRSARAAAVSYALRQGIITAPADGLA